MLLCYNIVIGRKSLGLSSYWLGPMYSKIISWAIGRYVTVRTFEVIIKSSIVEGSYVDMR